MQGDSSKGSYAPASGLADRQSGGQVPRRRTSLDAKLERFSARVVERSWRGGGLTATERGALLELISAIAALLGEEELMVDMAAPRCSAARIQDRSTTPATTSAHDQNVTGIP
jgi:hypothetical protein